MLFQQSERMESTRRDSKEHEQDERFVITNWKEFTSVLMPLTFPENIENFAEKDIQDFWMQKCKKLLDTSDKAFLLCKPQINQKTIRIGINVVTKFAQKFQHKLDCDYQSLFLGNKKQLLVYKTNNSILKYLRKYRLPNNYPKLKTQIDKIENKIDQVVISRNLDICLDRPVVTIDELTDKIESLRKKELEKPLTEFKNLIASILEDFASQPKRTELVFSLLRKSHLPFVKQLCKQYELYWNRFYTDGPKDQKYIELEICKEDPYKKSHMQSCQMETQTQCEIVVEAKQTGIMQPGEIKDWSFLRYKKDQVDMMIEFPDTSKKRPIDRVFLVDGLGNQSLVYEKKQEQKYLDDFSIVLKAYQKGYCQYRLATQNSVARTFSSKKIKLYFEDDSTSKKLYLLGEGQKTYLIPNTKRKTEEQLSLQDFYQTTQEKFIHILNCYDVSFGTCAFSIFGCNRQAAAWGSVYQSSQGMQLTLQITNIKRRLQKPCMIEGASNLRTISSGFDYCLATDKAGNIWAYGLNSLDQLGHGANYNKFGSDKFQIAEQFKGSEIFFIDAKATKSGGSIAIDKEGQLYRWGLNQVQKTQFPIKDSYGNVINYKTFQHSKQRSSIPYCLNKKYIFNPVKEIHAGHSFYLALTQKNELYGWGKYDQLGLGKMKQIITQQIDYLCNPIQLMNKVKMVATGQNHTVVVKEDNTVFAWGRSDCFTNDTKKKIIEIPVKLQVNTQTLKNIACGPDFTVFIHQENEQQYIDVIGCRQVFKKGHYQLPEKAYKVVCGEKLISLLI